MRKLLLFLFAALFFIPAISQTTYTGTLDLTDPTFNRPDEGTPPTNLSFPQGTNVRYDVFSVVIITPGLVTFTSNSGMFDNFGVLYDAAGFNPASPLTNALVASDDQSGTNFGFTYNFTTTGTYYLVVTSLKNNFTGSYTVTQTPVVTVPVKLSSFTAEKRSGAGNLIKWTTEQELNIETYTVLHSVDGKNFKEQTGAVLGAGRSAYSFIHAIPAAGVNYYRLKITEKSNRAILSHIVNVNNKKGADFLKVFPNPATNYLYIETKTAQSGKAQVSILTAGGEKVFVKEYIISNQPTLSVDVRKFAAGKYFVKTVINNQETISTFIKN